MSTCLCTPSVNVHMYIVLARLRPRASVVFIYFYQPIPALAPDPAWPHPPPVLIISRYAVLGTSAAHWLLAAARIGSYEVPAPCTNTIAASTNLGPALLARLLSPFSALLAAHHHQSHRRPSSSSLACSGPSGCRARDCLPLASPPSASTSAFALDLIFPSTGQRSDPLVVQPVKTLPAARKRAHHCLV